MLTRPKIILYALLTIGILWIAYLFVSDFAFPDTDWKLEEDERLKITSGQPVLQKFRASQNNLKRIDLLFAGTDIRPGGNIILKLKDETCNQDIREKIIFTESLGSDKSFDMAFDKIQDSKGKIYCLSIDFEPIVKKTKKANIFLTSNASPDNISLYDPSTNQQIEGKSVSMRPAYQEDNWLKNIERLNQRISQYKPWFLKHYLLYVIAIGFIIFSILVVILLILP